MKGSLSSHIISRLFGKIRWIERQYKKSRIDKNTYYDGLTELVMERALSPTSACIDVGCHKGKILRLMMKYAPQGIFMAFEPLPNLYEELLHNLPSDRVDVFNIALSDAKGVSSFNYVITNPSYSGFRKRRYDQPCEQDREITVRTDLLDNILASPPPRKTYGKISFIKIDVEGAELQVLKGARRTIERDKPIMIFEHGLGAADAYGAKPEDLYELLCSECGVKISLMDLWLKNKKPLSKAEFCRQFYEGLNYYFISYP